MIGIIGRPVKYKEHEGVLAYKSICDTLFSHDVFPICLIPNVTDCNRKINEDDFNKLKQMINFCDAIVLQGGDEFNSYDVEITKYLYEEDIPVLGICLGMQTMGYTFEGEVLEDADHNISKDYTHYIKINNDSLLYEIIGKEYIFVNSLHTCRVSKTNLDITASCGSVAEAVEDKNKNFFLGVQWHPEVLKDENSDKIFKAFIDAILQKKNN